MIIKFKPRKISVLWKIPSKKAYRIPAHWRMISNNSIIRFPSNDLGKAVANFHSTLWSKN